MYVCGPTVYNFAHIGNARPAVVFDVLARLLRRDHALTYARNVTDVDDKINAAAAAQGVEIGIITARYLAAYHEDMLALGVLEPDVEPRVTGHMAQIIAMIERLVAAGHAYAAEGHVLFDVASFADYGRLSRRSSDELLAGARVEVAPYKRAPGDFVLWKPAAADGVGWDSTFGYGRPGWHIECSAMAETHLGETIDIHGGGQDLVFPHHENEIAQSVCVHEGAAYARYWLHNGFVNVDSEKMSKSLGNVLLLRDLVSEHRGETVRMGLLSAHYRQPLDWTDRVLEESRQKLDRLYGALRTAGLGAPGASMTGVEPPAGVMDALNDDLNTPNAIAELMMLAREVNRLDDAERRQTAAAQLRAGAWLLGFLQADPAEWFGSAAAAGALSATEIEARIGARQAFKAARDFAAADAVRDELQAMGIVLEDSAEGTRWRRAH